MSTPTAFELMRLALVAALQQSATLGVAVVTDGFARQSTIDMIRQVDVQIADAKGSTPYAGTGAPREWDTVFLVQCKARNAPGDKPDTELDGLVQAVSEQLDTLDAAAIGALSIDLDPAWQWRSQDGIPPYAVARRLLRITHQTLGASLAPRP